MLIKSKSGKVWGEIKNGIYKTSRDRKKHLCRKFNAYGIQDDVLDRLIDMNVQYIDIMENHVRVFRSPVEAWVKEGTRAVLNEDDGSQTFLTFNHMKLVCDKTIKPIDEYA